DEALLRSLLVTTTVVVPFLDLLDVLLKLLVHGGSGYSKETGRGTTGPCLVGLLGAGTQTLLIGPKVGAEQRICSEAAEGKNPRRGENQPSSPDLPPAVRIAHPDLRLLVVRLAGAPLPHGLDDVRRPGLAAPALSDLPAPLGVPRHHLRRRRCKG